MEAVGEFVPDRAPWAGPAVTSRLPRFAAVAGAADAASVAGTNAADAGAGSGAGNGAGNAADAALALLRASAPAAAAEAALFGLAEAADFAGRVEDLSRTVEYFQLIAAAAVDRTRKESAASAPRPAEAGWGAEPAAPGGWLTGWTQDPDAAAGTGPDGGTDGRSDVWTNGRSDGWIDTGSDGCTVTGSDTGSGGGTGLGGGPAVPAAPSAPAALQGGVAADDGFRNATEFLRARLRISAPEARRRLRLAAELLPGRGLAGQPLPAVHGELGAAVAAGDIASHPATIITTALDRVRPFCLPETAAAMEHALTLTAAGNDPDFLARIARRWTEALDQDGAEPNEETLRRVQGAFLRKPRHGLQHLEIFATTEQFEHLATVMNTATNPRTGPDTSQVTEPGKEPGAGAGADAGTGTGTATATAGDPAADSRSASAAGWAGAAVKAGVEDSAVGAAAGAADVLDRRSRPQRLLDGLVSGCKAALAAGALPATGGLRPQVMATIDYRDLLQRLRGADGHNQGPGSPDQGAGTPGEGTGTLTFAGPVTASTIRQLACDADIIPVLLGGAGQVLDIGRAARVFPPHLRKALTARDQGCVFPQCTIPAPWCEAHHIEYWSRGGSTGTDNGTLLCSHHHHLIHKEQWTIRMRAGIPWFIPPPHLDPARTPRRNTYFRPD